MRFFYWGDFGGCIPRALPFLSGKFPVGGQKVRMAGSGKYHVDLLNVTTPYLLSDGRPKFRYAGVAGDSLRRYSISDSSIPAWQVICGVYRKAVVHGRAWSGPPFVSSAWVLPRYTAVYRIHPYFFGVYSVFCERSGFALAWGLLCGGFVW